MIGSGTTGNLTANDDEVMVGNTMDVVEVVVEVVAVTGEDTIPRRWYWFKLSWLHPKKDLQEPRLNFCKELEGGEEATG